jgi:hypothetical protein
VDRPEPGAAAGSRSAAWLVAACIVLASVPLLWVSAPPVMDFPNHLARIWLLAGGAQLPALASTYLVDWSQASTNISVDWIAAHLATVLPFPVLDRILRLAMFLGPPLGAICLGRAVHGRVSAWSIAPLAVVWGTTSIAGFLAYSISLGAALAFAALQYRMPRLAPITLGLHGLFAVALLSIHPFGLLFYLALMIGVVVGPGVPLPLERGRILRVVVEAAVVAMIGLAPLIGMLALSDAAPATGTFVHRGLAQLHPRTLLEAFLSPISTYDRVVDLVLVVPLALMVLAVTVRLRWGFHFGLLSVAALLLVLAAVAPSEIGDAAWIDRRFPLMAVLTLTAAIRPLPLGTRSERLMIAALLVAVVGKAGWITYVWTERERDLADLRAATRVLEPGDTVMLVKTQGSDLRPAPLGRVMADTANPVRVHLPTMLIRERQARIPTLFAIRGQQPIRVVGLARSPQPRMSSFVPYASVVRSVAEPGHIPRWRCSYRYLLLLGADEPASEPFDTTGLRLVAAQGFAALYAIDRPDPGASCD